MLDSRTRTKKLATSIQYLPPNHVVIGVCCSEHMVSQEVDDVTGPFSSLPPTVVSQDIDDVTGAFSSLISTIVSQDVDDVIGPFSSLPPINVSQEVDDVTGPFSSLTPTIVSQEVNDDDAGGARIDPILACPSTLSELTDGVRSYGGVGPGSLFVSYKSSKKLPGIKV